MKILLLGKNGQVGWELQRSLSVLGEVVALDRRGAGGWCGDLADLGGLERTVSELRPQVIVNAAAYTDVDGAERDPTQARTLNAEAPGVLARAAATCGALFIHYSSDYVFDGAGSTPWTEGDAAAPLNVYGRTKLAGEQAIAATGCRHLILRTSWVYGARGGNFVKTMLRLAQERERLPVVDDQIGAPTGADLLADVTAHAIRQLLPARGRDTLTPSGLYHVAASGQTSWCGYARYALERAQQAGVTLKLGPQGLVPIRTTDYPTPARRPLNSRLDTSLFRRTFGLCLPDWRQGVARMLDEIL